MQYERLNSKRKESTKRRESSMKKETEGGERESEAEKISKINSLLMKEREISWLTALQCCLGNYHNSTCCGPPQGSKFRKEAPSAEEELFQ